jgi:hypothetical protein|tara:strand:+ start:1251 stop:1766 length:516 start_codon:yes stop_codon:yes gene_type:complete
MQYQQQETEWPKDKNTLKGYKIFKNVNAVIANWIIRPGQATLCLADIVSNNKPEHIDKAMISLSGTCPQEFNPENFSEGEYIVVELCEPSKTYSTTGMANFVPNSRIPSPETGRGLPTAAEILDESEATTKLVITNVPKHLKKQWDIHCKQQGLQPWRAFKELMNEKQLPF